MSCCNIFIEIPCSKRAVETEERLSESTESRAHYDNETLNNAACWLDKNCGDELSDISALRGRIRPGSK